MSASRAIAMASLSVAVALVGCGSPGGERPDTVSLAGRGLAGDTAVIYLAASLTRAMQPVLDTFAARTGVVVQRESGASLEHARKLTELGRIPDILMLADEEVFPELLAPRFVTEWTVFARNRMVVAFTDRSKHAAEISASNWPEVLSRADVQVGRTDPDLAPAGYRTIIMLRLAERHYRSPGLADRLLANAPKRNIRGNAAELAALLAAGELDYIYEYRSLAIANSFRFVDLPPEIDLGDAAHAHTYATVTARARGPKPGTTVTFTGRPILYAMATPDAPPHPRAARELVAYLLGDDVRRMLRTGHVDMLDSAVARTAGGSRGVARDH
jgi:molybdate/tungstate transport system substrate-binding protein